MKNLPPISELKERIRRQSERTAWLRSDVESYLTAETVQEGLGTWPKKLSKTDVEFDPDEERTYGDVPGGKLSSLAARIVLTAKDEWRFLKVLRGVAEAMIAPLVAYLRVNLAMTRLEETINNSCHSGPVFACKHQDPKGREVGDELGSAPASRPFGSAVSPLTGMTDKGKKNKKPPTFKWSQSPRAAYGFAEARAAYGFDPRDTSVYWIEKRAARLRRKWVRYGKPLDGDDFTPPPIPHDGEHGKDIQSPGLELSFESPGYARPQDEERGELPGAEGASCEFSDEPDIPVRYFVPADADYNTIWPPMELPHGPPKPPRSTDQAINTAHDLQAAKPAVMRETLPLDETFLDSEAPTPSAISHDGEQRSCPSRHGKKIQSSSESEGLATPSALYTNRKARRAERRKMIRDGRAPPP